MSDYYEYMIKDKTTGLSLENPHNIILQAIIDEDKYVNEDIIVKFSADNELIKTEWNNIKKLRKYIPSGLPKYIRFPKMYKKTLVLMTPYYELGSISDNEWNYNNLEVLNSLINQVFINMFLNFHYYGFIYDNFNENCFDNILVEESENLNIFYNFRSPNEKKLRIFIIPNFGYRAMIINFEKCRCVDKTDGILEYWNSVYHFINSIKTDLIRNGIMITMNNFNKVMKYIKYQIDTKGHYDNSIKLHTMLLSSKYKLIDIN
jgi:hypothetical protein